MLDNCEHVIDDAARFTGRLLAEAPDARVLVTSREPLHLDDERVHRLGGLRVPPVADADIERYPAARLFYECAAAARMPSDDAPSVAEVVRRLDGLPLAIELAAGRLGAVSASELAQGLRERLSLLGGARVAPARQRTLEAAIQWSHDLVPVTEQRVLRRLAIFPASFDAAAAELVAAGAAVERAAVVPAIAHLVDTSLVVADRTTNPTRYRLLLTVRTFAGARLRAAGEFDGAARRHRDAYMTLAEEVGRETFAGRLAEGLRRARPEHENFQAALRWSLDQADPGPAIHLAACLAPYWFRIGRVSDGRELLEDALRRSASDDPWRPRALVGRAMLSQAAAAPEALAAADDAVAACETAGADPELVAIALGWRARARLAAGRLAAAAADLDRAGDLGAAVGSEEALGFADPVRGCVRLEGGDLDGAATLLTRARDRYRRMRGGLDAGYTLIDLARVRLAQAQYSEALDVAGDALSDFRRRDDPRGIAQALPCLGRGHAGLGEHERARPALERACTFARRWGLAPELTDAGRALAELGSREPDESREEPALG